MKSAYSTPLISVIVPVYNVAPYLSKCVESIINQTYKNLEIILVDDGSTDGSEKICDEFQQRDKRIKVIHKENGGLVSARKAGILIASGAYTAYVDGDDWIEANMYEIMLQKGQASDVVICGVERDFGLNISYEVCKVDVGIYQGENLEKLYAKMIYTGIFFERGILPYVWGKLFNTEVLRRNQLMVPDEIRVAEDAACTYPVLLEVKKVAVIHEYLYHYQMRDNSIMGINDRKEIKKYKTLYYYLNRRFWENKRWGECLTAQLDYLMVFTILLKNMELFQNDSNPLFPYSGIEKGTRLAVYGAGRFGQEFIRYLQDIGEYTLVVWVDNNERNSVKNPDALKEASFDYVLITVLMENARKNIFDKLRSMGIENNKIKMVDKKMIENGKTAVGGLLEKE